MASMAQQMKRNRQKRKGAKPDKNAPLGEGGRFAALKQELSHEKGIRNPGAVAAAIGRKKYGKAKFQAMAAKGR